MERELGVSGTDARVASWEFTTQDLGGRHAKFALVSVLGSRRQAMSCPAFKCCESSASFDSLLVGGANVAEKNSNHRDEDDDPRYESKGFFIGCGHVHPHCSRFDSNSGTKVIDTERVRQYSVATLAMSTAYCSRRAQARPIKRRNGPRPTGSPRTNARSPCHGLPFIGLLVSRTYTRRS